MGVAMLGKEVIARELTVVDLEIAEPSQLFDIMGQKFIDLGYVTPEYIPSIKEREAKYPTALPTEPYPVAIPHTEAGVILTPFIAPVRFTNLVPWGNMGDPDEKLDVKIAFMLGFNEPNAHIELLQILIYNFQKQDWVDRLLGAQTADEFYEACMEMEWTHD